MATLAELRKEAKGMGIAASVIRGASSANELQEIISDHSGNGNGSKGKKAAKGAVKAASKKGTAKASASKKSSTKNSKASKATKATKNSKSASSKSAPAKSGKGTAKRRATATDGDAGRHMLDRGNIDYSETEGWNPRDGSIPDQIHRALKKFRGNREKVFDHLVKNLWDFVPKKKQDGTKRSKDEAENLLRFRIAQTDWRFAIQTGQHEPSDNRVEYGSGGTKEKKAPAKAPAKRGRPAKAKVEEKPKRGRPAKNSKAEAPKKRGRPAGTKNKPKAEAPKRGRGRPKGSKNKK